jgi:mRNA interferase MazF
MRRGEIWWAALGEPVGSGTGFRRPVLLVQSNDFNDSAIRTIICATITTNLRLVEAPGNIHLPRKSSGLARESVVNVSQLITLDRRLLSSRIGRVSPEILRTVEAGIKLVLAL